MWLTSSRNDEGSIKHVQHEFHHCRLFLLEETTVPTLPIRQLRENHSTFDIFLFSTNVISRYLLLESLLYANVNSKSIFAVVCEAHTTTALTTSASESPRNVKHGGDTFFYSVALILT